MKTEWKCETECKNMYFVRDTWVSENADINTNLKIKKLFLYKH